MLAGDRYDAVISTTILEHWFRFFLGHVSWVDVGYYFPYEKSIAYTDAYFINGVFYTPFRFMGFDPFISSELSGLVIKFVGFLGAYLFCRRALSFGVYWSLLAAVLFTLSNGMTVHGSRIQLASVAFFPAMALMLWNMCTAFSVGDFRRFRNNGFFAGVVYGAWCLTCFYMAWFFFLYFVIFVLFFAVSIRVNLPVKELLLRGWRSLLFVIVIAVLAVSPFVYVYASKSLETGVRSYSEVLNWTVPLEGVLQVGTENFLWGGVYNSFLSYVSPDYVPVGEYYNVGFNFLLFLVFVLGCARVFKFFRDRNGNAVAGLIWLIAISSLVSIFLTINFSGKSAWYYVFNWFPGAKALRVVSAYLIFLAFPVILVAVNFLATRRVGAFFSVVLSVLLVVSEINTPALYLDRAAELKRIELKVPPPEGCKSFYVSGWNGQESLGYVADIYAHNVSAMLISQMAGIPTLNGVASFNPPGVDFSKPNDPDYDRRVLFYAKKHGVYDVCKLDLNYKTWHLISNVDIDMAFMPLPFLDESSWTGRVYDVQGLSSHESWGTWSIAEQVAFEFNVPLPEKFILRLTARAFGPNVGKDFKVSVGEGLNAFRFDGDGVEEKSIQINNPSKLSGFKIHVPLPSSPKDWSRGVNADSRSLGIGFVDMKIIPVE